MADEVARHSLGSHLRSLRSLAGVSLSEMASTTRISEHYLHALESDDLSDLPAPVFVKGFIRAYCSFLHVPGDEALALYQEASGVPAASPAHALSPRPRGSWFGHPLAVSVALLIVFGGGVLALNLLTRGVPRPAAPSAPPRFVPIQEPAVPTQPAAPPAPAVSAPAATIPVVRPPDAGQGKRLVVKAVESTWIGVQADEGRAVDELLTPGATREWTADKRFLLTIGNAGGIEIELNGRTLPSLGARGAVIYRLSLPQLPATGS